MNDHISICVCTYKRIPLLEQLLISLVNQQTGSFSYEIIVVDNDVEKSALPVVSMFIDNNELLSIRYDCQPVKNIALTRNRTVSMANGNLIAFIDDDEIAENNWLYMLHLALYKYNADAVFGPVIPKLPDGTPKWVIDGRFFERKRLQSGKNIFADARTGNALIKKVLLDKVSGPFDPEFGLTGGEDSHLFNQLLTTFNANFIWEDGAIVNETIPSDRISTEWLVKRAYRSGETYIRQLKGKNKAAFFIRAFLLLFIRLLLLLLALPMGKRVIVRKLCKIFICLGQIGSFFGVKYYAYKK